MTIEQRAPALEVNTDEMVVTERAGAVAWELGRGRRLTNRDVQDLTGLGRSGAWLMMGRLSRVLPVTFYNGAWCNMDAAMSVADGFEGDPPMK